MVGPLTEIGVGVVAVRIAGAAAEAVDGLSTEGVALMTVRPVGFAPVCGTFDIFAVPLLVVAVGLLLEVSTAMVSSAFGSDSLPVSR